MVKRTSQCVMAVCTVVAVLIHEPLKFLNSFLFAAFLEEETAIIGLVRFIGKGGQALQIPFRLSFPVLRVFDQAQTKQRLRSFGV